jgi:hypothetical protein
MRGYAKNNLVLFPLFAAVSAVLGTLVPSGLFETRSGQAGPTMVLVGVWFGIALAAAMATCGHRSVTSAAAVFLSVVLGWQIAVNLAIQLSWEAYFTGWDFQPRIAIGARVILLKKGMLAAGFVSGAVGALITWAGVSYAAPQARTLKAALAVGLAGAMLGPLLAIVVEYHTLLILLLPWQTGVATLLGWLVREFGAPSS